MEIRGSHVGFDRLFEQNGDQQLLWYAVLAIQKNESLDLVGYINAKFGGPATTMLNATLNADATNRTILRISDSLYGRVTDALVSSLDSGWQMLFNAGLKSFVEADYANGNSQ